MLIRDQVLVRQILRSNELHKRVPEQVRILAVVVPNRHLIEVSGKVTGAQMVVRTDDRLAE